MFTGPRRGGRADRRQRRLPARPRRALPGRAALDWRQDEVGRADHRKLYVIDGAVAWTGGAGIEDHFQDGGFHDVMVRVTGDVVRQAQAAFLTSFRGHGGPLPADLAPLLPGAGGPRRDAGRARAGDPRRLRGGVAGDPGADRRRARAPRHHEPVPHRPRHRRADPRRRAARRDGAGRRLPEVEQRRRDGRAQAPLRRAARGAASRSGRSPARSSTPRSWSPTTSSASARVNLDAWALYRNSEIMMIARSRGAAELIERAPVRARHRALAARRAAVGHARAGRELALGQARVLPLKIQ